MYLVQAPMTALEALAILEAAVLECKKRDINTPEVKAALDLLERYIWPKWLISQFRHQRTQVGLVFHKITYSLCTSGGSLVSIAHLLADKLCLLDLGLPQQYTN